MANSCVSSAAAMVQPNGPTWMAFRLSFLATASQSCASAPVLNFMRMRVFWAVW